MPARREGDRGAAAVETALCICFIVLPLTFGIMSYAYMLSFRQSLSQAATEGARAAAVLYTTATGDQRTADQVAAADAAVKDALQGLAGDHECADGVLQCTADIGPCPDDGGGTDQCVTVHVEYPYRDHALLPMVPGFGFTLPEDLSYSAVARVS